MEVGLAESLLEDAAAAAPIMRPASANDAPITVAGLSGGAGAANSDNCKSDEPICERKSILQKKVL